MQANPVWLTEKARLWPSILINILNPGLKPGATKMSPLTGLGDFSLCTKAANSDLCVPVPSS